jgi:hypothetical protein
MTDLYYNKYLKYKKKYLSLKQYGGYSVNDKVFVKFVGSGSFGCLICPPLQLTEVKKPEINLNTLTNIFKKSNTYFAIKDFSFNNYINCDYVGKIVALETKNTNGDSYEEEISTLLKIRSLDSNSEYTPKLIYANIHKGKEILDSIRSINTDTNIRKNIYKCIVSKIDPEQDNDYGYIILENAGITLHKKFLTEYNSFSIDELIKFLTKFSKLLEFIKILFDKNFLHLDIKFDNITIKDNDDLRLIDFGRTTQLNINNYDYIINSLLGSYNNIMYSFEPKIYINLLSFFNNNNIKKMSFIQLKEFINIKKNFMILIEPYDINSIGLNNIFKHLFKKDYDSNAKHYYNFNEYIYDYLKSEFIKYIESFEVISTDEFDVQNLLYEIFFPIIKKFDMYCMGIVLCNIVIIYNKNYQNYNDEFKNRFENLIKLLLLNKLNNVDEFISELNKIILDLEWLDDSNPEF